MARQVRKRRMTLSQKLKLSLDPIETKGPPHTCGYCGKGIMATWKDPVITAPSLGKGLFFHGACSKKVWAGIPYTPPVQRRTHGKTWKIAVSRQGDPRSALKVPQPGTGSGGRRWRVDLSGQREYLVR